MKAAFLVAESPRRPGERHGAVTNAVLKEALKLVFHPSPELARIALRPEVLGRAGRAADRERDQVFSS